MSSLKIRFIETRSFQRFSHGVRVEDLGPGLNVIAGPNEEGKSTLLRSLRAALFERHRSQPLVQEFRSLGRSVDPEVRVGLRISDVDYEVHKVFSQRINGRTVLTSSEGGRWQNEDAEHRLEELLGFTHANRGRSSAELQGPSGLLWVTQGEAFHAVSPRDEHLRLLHGTLDDNITEMLGGSDGERLHARISALYESLYDKRGQPRGELRAAHEDAERTARSLEEVRRELLAFQGKADSLAEKQGRLDAFNADRVLERAAALRDEADRRLAQVSARQQQVDEARKAVQLAEAHLAQASTAWKVRQEAVKAAGDSARALQESEAALASARRALDVLQPAVVAARERSETARSELAAIEARSRLLERWLDREQIATLDEQVRKQLSVAESTALERRVMDAERGSMSIDRELLDELEKIQREQERMEARRQAGAARMDFQLEPDQEVLLDEQPIRGEGSVPILATARLQVGGIGRFTLHPGAGAAVRGASSAQELAGRLQELLARAGVRDVNAAREALQRKDAAAARLEVLQATLAVHAPRGLDALRDEAARLARRLGDLRGELDGTERPDGDREGVQQERDAARRDADEAARELQGVDAQATELHTRLVEARSTRAHEQKDLQLREREVASAREAADDETLARAVADQRQVVDARKRDLGALEAALAADDPAAVALEARRTREVHDSTRTRLDVLSEECNTLRIELQTLGHQGLAEQVADLQAAREQADRRAQDLTRRGQAVKLLVQVMDDALNRARQSVSRPILRRLRPYIEKVIPGAVPLIDENLALQGLARDDVEQEFQVLSMGTREQLAVLIRLAYADALAEAGEPVCVVLDDALVNTDDERLERMLSVLFEAARRYQVLVLTCHARAWMNAGGRLLHLQDCKVEEP